MRVDELNDETEAHMDEMTDRIRALEKERDAATERADSVEAMGNRLSLRAAILETERDAAVKRAEEAEGERVRLESAVTFYRDGQRQEEKSHLQAAAYAEEMKKQVASLRSQLSEAEAREGRRKEALEAWGILRYAERDQDDQDTGRMLERCRECGRKAVQPAPIQHKKRCLVAAALSPSPVSGAAAKEPSDG